MLQIIRCEHCNSVDLRLNLKFTYKFDRCNLYHVHSSIIDFHFCCLNCMFNWFREKEIEQKGFPCYYCRGTGFLGGFKENGSCPTCQGTSKIVGHAFSVEETNLHKNPHTIV